MEKLVIDRFEGKYAVCEKQDKSIVNISSLTLPEGALEGSCLLVKDDGKIELDLKEFHNRKVVIEKLMDDLFE